MNAPKLTRHQARVHEEILDAAARAFSRGGYSATSVDEIAKEAEVATSTLYRYFAGKEAIYNGLIEKIARQVTEVFDEPVMPSLSYEQRVELLIRRQLSLIESNREFFLMLVADDVLTQWRLTADDTVAGSAFQTMLGRLRDVLQRGVEERQLREIDPALTATMIYGALTMIFFSWTRGAQDRPLQDYAPEILSIIFHGAQRPRQVEGGYGQRFG